MRNDAAVALRSGPSTADVHQLVRALAAGDDPLTLAHQALRGAVGAGGGSEGVLLFLEEGQVVPLSATPAATPGMHEAARAAATSGRPVRRAEGGTARSVLATPVRAGRRVLGAIAISGEMGHLDPTSLSLFADTTALVLVGLRRASPLAGELLDAVAAAGAERTHTAVLERLLDAAEELFGATAGFGSVIEVANPGGSERLRVLTARGIAPGDLQRGLADPRLRALLASSGVAVEDVGNGVGQLLGEGSRCVVTVPLRHSAGPGGHLLLLLRFPPDAGQRALLDSFARAAGSTLNGPDLRRRLRHREEVMSTALGAVSFPVLIAGTDGTFLTINPAAADLFRIDDTFEVGQPVANRIPHPTIEDLLLGGMEGEAEVALVLPSGAEHVFRAISRPVVVEGGERIARVVVLEDITSQSEAERTKSDLLAVIGHELRTPLTALKASVHHLSRRGGTIEAAALQRTVEVQGRSVDRLERLVEDLLFVASVEDGATNLHLRLSDLGALVDSFADDRVSVVRSPGELIIGHDPRLLGHAIGHLVENAAKYSDDAIEIEVISRPDEVEVAVIDHGVGIWSGDIPSLFQRFRQLDGSATRAHGGTGLGLYIARRVVEAHDGRIWCTSRMGHGSRFAFAIPR